ncbi:MAG TPA: glycosyltransferase family 39 protein [Stellaceae bacterium]|nr:glycosyltransferase family 39 protein [Stellaceae bacterium]
MSRRHYAGKLLSCRRCASPPGSLPDVIPSPSSKPEIAAVAASERAWALWTLAAIAVLTAIRLAWIAVASAGLYPDEAQYWDWAKHLAFGYYSKPPLIPWLIALTTAMFGNSEWAIRLSAPLLHAAAAGFIYAIGARLYDQRVGFWSALTYATLPGVSLSSFVISTDAALLPCWAAALYAFVRARGPDGGRWWPAVGVAVGLGLLAKYAMAYWLISAFAFVLLTREEQRHLQPLLVATCIALAMLLPNLWWNWSHGFASFRAVGDNAHLTAQLFHPRAFLKFVGSQLGVVGPLVFAGLIGIVLRPAALADRSGRLLAFFVLPTLALVMVQSLLSHAEPNWAAPAYVAASVLVVAWTLGRGWRGWLTAAIAINLAAAVALFGMTDALEAVGIAVPAKYDPLHRLRGWNRLGRQVSALLAAHPGLTLLADDRELIAALTYYVHPHPFDAVEWSPVPGITDEWRLVNNIEAHRGGDFLAVTVHNLVGQMRPQFASFAPLATIRIPTGRDGGMTYHIYIARDFRGSAQTVPRAGATAADGSRPAR